MADSLLSNVLIPVASEDDARTTMHAVLPRLGAEDGTGTLLFVVEKAGGALDKAAVEQQEAYAGDVFEAAGDVVRDANRSASFDTDVAYGSDVAQSIIDAAHEIDATAIVFTPRQRSRWTELLTGNVARDLIEESDVPVITLPEAETDE
jgi:nucleotide-binding universal stress UspA family protein